MVVRELITRLGFQLNNAQVNNAERATQRLKNQADQAAQSFRNIIASIAAFQAVKGLVHVADTMQSLRARIEQLPQTIMPAGEAFDIVAQHAIDARASIEAYGTLYNRIGNAAKDYISTQEDLLKVTDTISKALVVGGATAAEAGSVMTQFSQALGAGTLQGEEFRAMAEAAPQYMDELAKALGIPRGEMKKLASEGKITTKQVIEATKNMADYFEMRFKQMPMTIGQAVTIVGNRFARMVDRMNRESNIVTRTANKILDIFDSIERGIDSLVKSFDGWDNTLRFIGATLLAATGVLIGFSSASIAAIAPWILIAAAIGLAAIVIEDLMVAAEGGESVILGFVTWLQSGTAGATALGLALTALGAVFTVWGAIASAKYIQVALAATMAGLSAVKAGAMMAAGWLAGMWPIALVIAAIAGIGYAGYKIVENWTEIKAWFSETFDWFMEKFKALSNFVSGIFGGNGFGNITGNAAFNVTPQTMAASGGKTIVSNNTNTVNIQVPAGTPQDQAAFVQNQTQKYLDSINKPITTRDAMAYGN